MDFDELEQLVERMRREITLLESEELGYAETIREIRAEADRKIAKLRERADQAKRQASAKKAELRKAARELEDEQKRREALAAKQSFAEGVRDRWIEYLREASHIRDLYPYQLEGVLFMLGVLEKEKGAMNCDEMGLGKTIQAAVLIEVMAKKAQSEGRQFRVLWLTKKSLVNPSSREIRRWANDVRTVPLDPVMSKEQRQMMIQFTEMAANGSPVVYLANYETLRTMPEVAKYDYDLVVIDEVHKLRGGANANGPTAAWRLTRDLCHSGKVKNYVFLTGTPVQNKPRELWSYLHIFNPERFKTANAFERIFCSGWGDAMGIDMEGLMKVLSPMMIRRRQDEVGFQLPDMIYEDHEVPFDTDKKPGLMSHYEAAMQMTKEFQIWYREQPDSKPLTAAAVIAQLTRLRQIGVYPGELTQTIEVVNMMGEPTGETKKITVNWAGYPKLTEAKELIEELQSQGEQVVVVSAQFNEPLEWLRDNLDMRTEILHGKTSSKSGIYEEKFQNRELDVLLINMTAGAEGLNLQKSDQWKGGASHMIFLDFWYNPAAMDQMRKRLLRIDTKAPVIIHRFITPGSVDEVVLAISDHKELQAAGITENAALRPGDWKDILKGLLV